MSNIKRAGIIGIGDMGSGLAKNLIKNGFEVAGWDLKEDRMQAFADMGGQRCADAYEVGQNADAVFVMVMNGAQVDEVVLGERGLLKTLKPGSAVILTATIKTVEVQALAKGMAGSGIHLIDTPVSGGFPGAQGGTLTLMCSAEDQVLAEFRPVLEAVSKTLHHVGTEAGMGQTMKACLQTLIGSVFSATYEATVLAAKAGLKGEDVLKVFSTSSVGSPILEGSIGAVIDRQFEKTGSHIATMHKDLTISMALAEQLGVPLHMASSAMQIFHQGKSRYPDGDNQICTRVIEEIVGAELHRDGPKEFSK